MLTCQKRKEKFSECENFELWITLLLHLQPLDKLECALYPKVSVLSQISKVLI